MLEGGPRAFRTVDDFGAVYPGGHGKSHSPPFLSAVMFPKESPRAWETTRANARLLKGNERTRGIDADCYGRDSMVNSQNCGEATSPTARMPPLVIMHAHQSFSVLAIQISRRAASGPKAVGLVPRGGMSRSVLRYALNMSKLCRVSLGPRPQKAPRCGQRRGQVSAVGGWACRDFKRIRRKNAVTVVTSRTRTAREVPAVSSTRLARDGG